MINRPNGTDVYKGVPKDYTGDVSANVCTRVPNENSLMNVGPPNKPVISLQDVTPQNFLAVLKGDSSNIKGGSGKVLKR